MADLDAFEVEVKAHIKQLLAKDATSRRRAAEWLGEAGDPTAITALKQAYKNDADPRVREAAAYSLGMFRKLEQELAGNKSDEAMALLEKIVDGKMGRRVPIPKRTVVKLEIALLLSAVLVAILAFVLPPVIKGGALNLGGGAQTANDPSGQSGNVADKDRTTLISELRAALNAANTNATKLQGQYQIVLGGGTLACDQTFDTLTPYTLSTNNISQYPELAEVANTVNQTQTDLTTARTSYNQVCDEGQTLEPGAFGPAMATTVAVIQQLTTAGDALTIAESITLEVPTPLAVETPTAEVAPTTSSAGVDIRNHLTALQTMLDDLIAPRGGYTLLNQYWNEGATSGVTDGCRETPPTIPENYPFPAELTASAPNLKLAVDLMNTGLGLLRAGWAQFSASCIAGTLGPDAAAGLSNAQNAKIALDTAQQQVANLRAQT
jgi:hypothetical protein